MDCPDLAKELGAGNESIESRRSRNEDVQKKINFGFYCCVTYAGGKFLDGPRTFFHSHW
jgi:hypothetical protein